MDREQKIVHFMTETCEGRAILHKLFASEMPYWLATEAGQDWMDKVAEASGMPRVLVVVHGDGYMEAYSEGKVAVKIAEVACGERAAGGSVHSKCQSIAMSMLPMSWRRVWDKGRLRSNYFFNKLTPTKLIQRKINSIFLDSVGRAEEEIRGQ